MGLLKKIFSLFCLISAAAFITPNALPAAENAAGVSHVVLIGVDGAGAYFKQADTPNLDKIYANGAITYTCVTSDPSISAECWGAMLHGVTPEFHGLTNKIATFFPYPADSPCPSVFRVVRENMPDANLASFCSWPPVNTGIIEEGIGVYKDNAEDDDAAVTDKVCAYLAENKPTLLYVHYNEVDMAGHDYGFGGEGQLKQIHTTDGYIQKIYDAAKKNGMLDSTLFIVTADHGGFEKSHGGWTDGEKYVMFAAAGPGIEKSEIGEMAVRDTASVILYALGLADKQPETWTGRVPDGLFKGVEAKERPVYNAKFFYRHRDRAASPTPKDGSDAPSLLGKDRVRVYLPFDGDVKDVMGKVETSQVGKLYFVDGYFGQGARFKDGCVTVQNCQPGKESFSAAFWMKAKGPDEMTDPPIFANKNWEVGNMPGFILALRPRDVRFNYGDGKDRMDFDGPLPFDYRDGWIYVVLVVDRQAGEVKLSFDFRPFYARKIKDEFLTVSFDSFPDITVGQDATGKYEKKLDAVLDEFMLIDGTLDDADVAKLKTLYLGE